MHEIMEKDTSFRELDQRTVKASKNKCHKEEQTARTFGPFTMKTEFLAFLGLPPFIPFVDFN